MRRFAIAAALTVSTVAPQAVLGQEPDTRSFDEIILEACTKVPEIAGVIGPPPTLRILVTARRPGLVEEARAALDEAFGELPGGGRQFDDYPDTMLVDAKYSWCQLMEWFHGPIWDMSFEGLLSTDIDDARNVIVFGVLHPKTQAQAIEDAATRLGIPEDALIVEQERQLELASADAATGREKAPLGWWLLGSASGVAFLGTLALAVRPWVRRRRIASA